MYIHDRLTEYKFIGVFRFIILGPSKFTISYERLVYEQSISLALFAASPQQTTYLTLTMSVDRNTHVPTPTQTITASKHHKHKSECECEQVEPAESTERSGLTHKLLFTFTLVLVMAALSVYSFLMVPVYDSTSWPSSIHSSVTNALLPSVTWCGPSYRLFISSTSSRSLLLFVSSSLIDSLSL